MIQTYDLSYASRFNADHFGLYEVGLYEVQLPFINLNIHSSLIFKRSYQ